MPKPTKPTLSPYTDQLPDVNNPATWADRTPLFWNWVTGDGYTNLSDVVDYGDAAAAYIDTALAGSETLVDSLAGHYSSHDTYRCTVGGTANSLTLTTAYSLTTVPQNTLFYFFPTTTNTGNVTFDVDGLGAVTARAKNGSQMPAGYLRVGKLTKAYYDGTQWIVDREDEIITNANGTAVRYANGVMTQRGEKLGSGTTTPVTVTLPAAHASSNYTIASSSAVVSIARFTGAGNRTATTFELQVFNTAFEPQVNTAYWFTDGVWY